MSRFPPRRADCDAASRCSGVRCAGEAEVRVAAPHQVCYPAAEGPAAVRCSTRETYKAVRLRTGAGDGRTAVSTRILIVDDHASFRATARLLLESEGFDVVGEAGDGESALDQVHALAPDVVLLDVQLPGIDGFEVAARLSRCPSPPAVVLVSSRERGEFGPALETCGARGFVTKADLSGERLRALLDAGGAATVA